HRTARLLFIAERCSHLRCRRTWWGAGARPDPGDLDVAQRRSPVADPEAQHHVRGTTTYGTAHGTHRARSTRTRATGRGADPLSARPRGGAPQGTDLTTPHRRLAHRPASAPYTT